MKVKQLINILEDYCKPDDIIMLQSDPEGNSYGHLGVVFPVGEDSGGLEPIKQTADFNAKIDDCVILVPYTTVGIW